MTERDLIDESIGFDGDEAEPEMAEPEPKMTEPEPEVAEPEPEPPAQHTEAPIAQGQDH